MRNLYKAALAALTFSCGLGVSPSVAQQAFIGEIQLFASLNCPRGWEPANGQVLQIDNYSALFAVYGARFGGDGTATFAMPNMGSRFAVHQGQGGGLSNYPFASQGGQQSVRMNGSTMASHAHTATLVGSTAAVDTSSPDGSVLATTGTLTYDGATTPDKELSFYAGTDLPSGVGANEPFPTQQPALAMLYCVATTGIFPSPS